MTSPPTLSLATLCAQAYAEAYACHGNLNLDPDVFSLRLQQIIDQQLPVDGEPAAACKLLEKLYKKDLYLTCACTTPAEAAWSRFLRLYQRQIKDLACYTCGSVDLGEEVADVVLTGLYMPDRRGHSRIGAYDGRMPLSAWLRVIVIHQSYKECKRKFNQFVPLADRPDLSDPLPTARLEALLRNRSYKESTMEALRQASRQLSDRERLILLLRYEEGLQGKEIAQVLKVDPATVSRGFQTAQQKLKAAVITFLAQKWEGRSSDINECLADLLENPGYSLLALLKEALPQR